jgi:acetyltransferase
VPASAPTDSPIETLRDGRRVSIRAVRPDDAPHVQQFVRELSPAARRNRFFGPVAELSPRQLERMTRFDAARELALVALDDGADAPRIVAIAQSASCDPACAELAVVVADAWQRNGLGGRLLARLLVHGARSGLRMVGGLVLAANRPMLALAGKLGFAFLPDEDDDVVRIEKPLAPRPGGPRSLCAASAIA